MQTNPLSMSLEEVERELAAARERIHADAVQALGSEAAVREYERLRRRAERMGPEGDAAFEALYRFEDGLSETQRRLLFGCKDDPRLEPEELDRIRLAFQPALLAERPEDLFSEMRRSLFRLSTPRLKELPSLSGLNISRHLPEFLAAIRVREALCRLREFGLSDAGILNGIFRDFLRQGLDPEDARALVRAWVGFTRMIRCGQGQQTAGGKCITAGPGPEKGA